MFFSKKISLYAKWTINQHFSVDCPFCVQGKTFFSVDCPFCVRGKYKSIKTGSRSFQCPPGSHFCQIKRDVAQLGSHILTKTLFYRDYWSEWRTLFAMHGRQIQGIFKVCVVFVHTSDWFLCKNNLFIRVTRFICMCHSENKKQSRGVVIFRKYSHKHDINTGRSRLWWMPWLCCRQIWQRFRLVGLPVVLWE